MVLTFVNVGIFYGVPKQNISVDYGENVLIVLKLLHLAINVIIYETDDDIFYALTPVNYYNYCDQMFNKPAFFLK